MQNKLMYHLVNLGDLCKFTQGVQIPSSETLPEMRPGLIRYVYIRDLFSDKFTVYVEDKYPQKVLSSTDIVMVNTGATAGNVYRGKLGVLCNNAFRIQIKHDSKKSLNKEFLWHFLNSEQESRMLKRLFNNAGQPHVGHKNVAKLKISLPPFPEQCKIAEILSTWDKAIELVGKQIEAKQRLKKGLMQQLLTKKVRFPGFAGRWEEVELKQLAKLLVSNVDKKSFRDEAPVVLCNYMDVYVNEYITRAVDFMPATATKAEIQKFSLQIGDVILTKDSETREDIASTSVVTQTVDNLICGYHLAILRPDPNKADSIFMAKLLSYGRTHHHFVAYANGATRFGLTISSIENTKLMIPSIDEQKRIAQFFLILDREIEKLGKKNEVLRKQKQGLMQKLLTGEVKV